MAPENLLTVPEVATYLKISARTVYRLIEQGELIAYRIGKQWRLPQDELIETLRAAGNPE